MSATDANAMRAAREGLAPGPAAAEPAADGSAGAGALDAGVVLEPQAAQASTAAPPPTNTARRRYSRRPGESDSNWFGPASVTGSAILGIVVLGMLVLRFWCDRLSGGRLQSGDRT